MIIDASLKKLIELALKEDIGSGDITTDAVIPKAKKVRFGIVAKQDCVVCGLTIAEAVFEMVNNDIRFKPLTNEGYAAFRGKVIAYVEGNCKSILAAERTALNFLSWLSGTATLTLRFVEAVKGIKSAIFDTRKTIPTLRRLQKYAVRIGGGRNHRMGLYDQVLIKDNHIAVIMDEPTIAKTKEAAIELALKNAKSNVPKGKMIEIEVSSLQMLKVALRHNPDIIMLDNMSVRDIKEAVRLRDAYRIKIGDIGFKIMLEVSGNVNLENVKEIAASGVDMISIGSLTHSSQAIDISLEPC